MLKTILVLLVTTYGNITVELYPDKAPKTVDNFVEYVEDGHYDNTLFHRVIDDFMVQGGGYTTDYREKPLRKPVRNEADNGLSNVRGTIAMARTSAPHSATAQFFFNTVDNGYLDKARARDGWGYTVFGKVVDGMDVIDRIGKAPVGRRAIGGQMVDNVPLTPVVITKVRIVKSLDDAKAVGAKATPDKAAAP